MPELKEKLEKIKKEFSRRIDVKTISAQFWCEKQVELRFLYDIDEEVGYIRKGRDRHEELQREVADLVEIPEVEKIEDIIGIKLHNAITGLLRLISGGRTRELPIFGNIDGWFIIGFIDELEISNGRLHLIERKTRKGDGSPPPAQQLPHKVQAMIYYKLLSRLQNEDVDYGKEILDAYSLDENTEMSDKCLKLLVERGLLRKKDIEFERNLRRKATYFVNVLKRLPPLSRSIKIIYESQKTKKVIDIVEFSFDEKWVDEKIDFARKYWIGRREAYRVSDKNKWKCKYCNVRKYCS